MRDYYVVYDSINLSVKVIIEFPFFVNKSIEFNVYRKNKTKL